MKFGWIRKKMVFDELVARIVKSDPAFVSSQIPAAVVACDENVRHDSKIFRFLIV
jgi:hypothetical protein